MEIALVRDPAAGKPLRQLRFDVERSKGGAAVQSYPLRSPIERQAVELSSVTPDSDGPSVEPVNEFEGDEWLHPLRKLHEATDTPVQSRGFRARDRGPPMSRPSQIAVFLHMASPEPPPFGK